MTTRDTTFTRRNILKSSGATVTGLAAGTLVGAPVSEAVAAPVPTQWDEEADVVVVGLGGAGGSTAVAAHDAGAKVLVIEKASESESGGNTRVSGNLIFNPEPADKAITYMKAMAADFPIPDDMLKVWAEEMGKNVEWVKSIGGEPIMPKPQSRFCAPEYPELPGAECAKTYFASPGSWGQGRLYEVLMKAVATRNIKVRHQTPARELIQNPQTKEILGVVAASGGKPVNIKARKGVVLTCGGFENNPEMMRDFLNLPQCTARGTPHNTGDGIKMVQRVGAALWHLGACAGAGLAFKIPGTNTAVDLRTAHIIAGQESGLGYIYVDGDGKRFVDELIRAAHGYVRLNSKWQLFPTPLPAYLVFDETCRMSGAMSAPVTAVSTWAGTILKVRWSKDNSEEIAKGWIVKAGSLAELAAKISVPVENLQATVAKYNQSCAAGVDQEFGRKKENLIALNKPPFYAMRMFPAILNTQGGPRRNPQAQIVDPDGQPIPRLYSAGEFGSMYSFLYNGGGNIGECLAFGRIAGRNAAALKAWG